MTNSIFICHSVLLIWPSAFLSINSKALFLGSSSHISQVFMHFLASFGVSHPPLFFSFLHFFIDNLSLHSPSPLSGPPSSSHVSQVLGHFLAIFSSSHRPWSFQSLHFLDLSLHLPSPPWS